MTELQQKLLNRYVEIISKPEHQAFLNDSLTKESLKSLSRLFLTFAPDDYDLAKENILIVGRETRGWLRGMEFDNYDRAALEKCLDRSQNHYHYEFGKENGKGNSFWNFMRYTSKHYQKGALLWGNLYALDYGKNDPKKCKEYFGKIEALSGELLKAVIEILQPKVVILATGLRKTRAVYFPDAKTDEEFKKKYSQYPVLNLWKFNVPEYDFCDFYRINHPRSCSKLHREIRRFLISELSK